MSKDVKLVKTLTKLSEMVLKGADAAGIRDEFLRLFGGEKGYVNSIFEFIQDAENENVKARLLELAGKFITTKDDNAAALSTMETEDVLSAGTLLLKEAGAAICPHCGGDLVEYAVTKAIGGDNGNP